MALFVPLFFLFYSLVHYYLYRKVRAALLPKGVRRWALLLFLGLMTLSPAIWRFLDREGLTAVSRWVALAALLWMGFVIYFFMVGLLVDLLRRFRPVPPRASFLITMGGSLLLSAYSHLETYLLQVERYTIHTPKIPPGREVKILHISDLHLGPVMREGRVRMVLEVYEREKPDLVVATGDMVDGNMKDSDHLAEMLGSMDPPLGKYAVTGNHEYYAGLEQSLAFLHRAGFRVLREEVVKVGDLLNVVGVDDPDGERLGYEVFTDEVSVLRRADRDRYTVLIKHRPVVERSALPYLDLILAGHSHGGVLFFVGYTVLRVIFETDRGIKELAPGKFIVVSKGVGTGGPPMRLLSPPDVVVVTLRGLSQGASPGISPP